MRSIGRLAFGVRILADPKVGVSDLARRMVCSYGMGETLGHQAFERLRDGHPVYFEDEARQIGIEVRRLTDEAHALARRVLIDEHVVLERVAAALLEHETLTGPRLQALLAPPIALRASDS